MTPENAREKLLKIYAQWRDHINTMSTKELKEYIKSSPKRAVLHELELNHRMNGGLPPIYTIAEKMVKDNNFKIIHVDHVVNFRIGN